MNLLITKYVLFSCIVFCENALPVTSISNPHNVPVISINLEHDVVPKPRVQRRADSILEFVGENIILYALFTKITVTCSANYLIRWDSTILVESYDLPKRYMEGNEYGQDGLPKTFRYETSMRLSVNSTTAGFVLCLKAGDSHNSSELMMYPGNAVDSQTVKSLRESRGFRTPIWYIWPWQCPPGFYKDRRTGEIIWRHFSQNSIFKVYEQFGLVVRTDFSSIHHYEFCLGPSFIEAFEFDQSLNYSYPSVVPQLMGFLNKTASPCNRVIVCGQWFCSNLLHCIIAEKIAEPVKHCWCYPSGKQLSRYVDHHTELMTIQGQPEDQMVVNQRMTFRCSAVSFLLGQQIVFGIRFRNNSVKYLDSFWTPEEPKTFQDGEIFYRTLNLTLEPGMIEVICMAPRFDSEQWYNISANISLTTNASIGEVQANKGGGGEGSDVTIIIVATATIFAMCFIAGTCYGRRYVKFNKSFRALTEEEIEQFRRGIYRASVVRNSVVLGLTYQTTPFQNENSEADFQIEHGNPMEHDRFMSVFPATVKGSKAIARTTDEKTNTLFFKEFLKDIKVMNHISTCSHPNIVEFLGAVTPNIQNRIICAGYEASSMGTLKDFLRSCSNNCISLIPGNADTGNVAQARYRSEVNQTEVTTLTMLQWCDQMATAMTFLQRENLVHGDLNASNVLLFPINCIKISDLSACRKQYERDYYLGNYKPPPRWRWMAIELFRSKKFTIKSDVWAYGVTLWEIFSLGEDPHPGINWSPNFVLKLEGGHRMDKPTRGSQDIYQLLLCCWYRYPNDRPNFGEIKEKICEFIKRMQ